MHVQEYLCAYMEILNRNFDFFFLVIKFVVLIEVRCQYVNNLKCQEKY